MENEFRAALEQLEDRCLMSTTLAESFAAAQNVEVAPAGSSTVQTTLANPAEGNFYQLTAPALGWMTIEMKGQADGMDPVLTAYDSFGRVIAYNNNASRLTRDSKMVLVLRAGQSVYVKAAGLGGVGGAYSLGVSSRAVDDVGNTSAAARVVLLNNRSGTAQTAAQINYGQDVDAFKVVALRTGTMTVDVSRYGVNGLLPAITVLDGAGQTVAAATDTDSNGKANVSFASAQGGAYYVQVASMNQTTGWYILKLTNTTTPMPTPTPTPDPTPTPTPDPTPTPTPDPGITIAPGTTISAAVRTTAGGLQLVVLGTTGNDVIVLSQTAAGLVMTTAAGSQSFAGTFAGLVLYGFAGGDTLRLDQTVAVAAEVYGGDGNDSLFASGAGLAKVYGEAGDDLLVTVGGNADQLTGGDGLDSVWMDSRDSLADASAAEIAGGSIHRIAAFTQPWTTNPSSASYVSLEIAGQSIDDPTMDSAARGWTNFASRPLFVDGPQYTDIQQGSLGDCYYLASLGSLAQTDPQVVRQMIAPLGDGTYAVRFFRNGTEMYYRIDADLPVSSGTSLAYAHLSPQGESWAPLMEKAYAYFRYDQNTYASIVGGWMATVYTQLTNKTTTTQWTSADAGRTYSFVLNQLTAGHGVTAGTITSPTGPVAGSHAYVVESAFTVDGVQYIRVYNPWGVDGRGSDSNTRDGLVTMTANVFVANFDGVVACNA